MKEKNGDFFLVIDSRQFEAQINFESIEDIEEVDDYTISITFLAPSDEKGSGMNQMTETYECFESKELIKLFKQIQSVNFSIKPQST